MSAAKNSKIQKPNRVVLGIVIAGMVIISIVQSLMPLYPLIAAWALLAAGLFFSTRGSTKLLGSYVPTKHGHRLRFMIQFWAISIAAILVLGLIVILSNFANWAIIMTFAIIALVGFVAQFYIDW